MRFGHWGGGRERCMRGGRHGGPWGGGEWGRGRGFGLHGGGPRRMFEQGDLKLVVLGLLGQKPHHGYELIKAVEEMSGGAYAPSPGVIYPLLTMLEELGLAQVESSDGAKKRFALTQEGQDALATKRDEIESLFARLAAAREMSAQHRPPQIVRAIENLKTALRLRAERGQMTDDQIAAIAAAIDAAAQAVERA